MNSKNRGSPRSTRGLSVFLMIFLFSSCWVEAAEVRGRVLLEGAPPEPEVFTIPPKVGKESTRGCGSSQKRSQELLVDSSGGVKNAVVWMDSSGEAASAGSDRRAGSDAQVVLDQKECEFNPHVILLVPGKFLSIRNSDPVLHNVRIFRESRAEDIRSSPVLLFHQWQKSDASELPWLAPEPGRYVVRCGIHPWMYAWVVVLSSPVCAVTGPSGSFEISGVPAGRHTLHLWHETLGRLDLPFEIGAEGLDLGLIRLTRKDKISR